MSPREVRVVGWREVVGLPGLGVPAIRAKVDTGARTSALHAWSQEVVERDGVAWVRFEVHPLQRSSAGAVVAEARLVDRRAVRSSSGRAEERLVVETEVELGGQRWPIELTLTRRDAMGFRMLLGRQAIRRRFVVDPGRSWLAGRRARATPPSTPT